MVNYADLYSDYLLVNQGQSTATGLSALLEGAVSHDQLTRYLGKAINGSAQLWQQLKPLVRTNVGTHVDADAVLIIDDTVQAKPHMDENELICWHYDHCANRSVKGINQISCLYHRADSCLPVSYALVTKPVLVTDTKTGQLKRKSLVTKQELFRQMVTQAVVNKLVFKYILSDIWYCCKDNINHVAQLEQDFIFPIRDNRKVYLSQADKALGLHQPISALSWEQNQCQLVWLPGVEVPLSVSRHLSKDGQDPQAVFYLLTNDLTADAASIKTYYAHAGT
jgi:DDE superfamily endonuclease